MNSPCTHKKEILYDSIYIRFKNRQNKSIVTEVTTVVTSEGEYQLGEGSRVPTEDVLYLGFKGWLLGYIPKISPR